MSFIEGGGGGGGDNIILDSCEQTLLTAFTALPNLGIKIQGV